MNIKQISTIVAILALFLVTGCTTQVTRSSEASTVKVRALKNVTAEMSPQAIQKVADGVNFDINRLHATLRTALKSKQLIADDGDYDLKVVIKDVRIRSTGSAVMFGIFAGDDHLFGDAIVLDKSGEAVYTYTAKASYALGGFAGGSSTRIDWLYEKFAELVSDELDAKRSEGPTPGEDADQPVSSD